MTNDSAVSKVTEESDCDLRNTSTSQGYGRVSRMELHLSGTWKDE
jgi:hypothetical protein